MDYLFTGEYSQLDPLGLAYDQQKQLLGIANLLDEKVEADVFESTVRAWVEKPVFFAQRLEKFVKSTKILRN